ncbi:lysocardiolipin acyltransferase 1-like [Dreissena polymorpha]|uniref:Phospholipid/glycerol acyltransferase domain-containing protein n=1 Tax=Dreissena polymorpha TaxID=45954 RepID=A0A9D4JJF7_DREPO|nr:lysocardiolipin acyltransferase 1-like [Dreissena polymorpha]KAH3811008.1 hypothetical protein DPMN_139408 [Dreissena polymorpha]
MVSLDLNAMKQRCRGVALAAILLLSAFFGFNVFSPVFIAVFVFRLNSAQFVVDSIFCTWFALAAASFETLYGIKIRITGEVQSFRRDVTSIIVLNHRTRLDWLFYSAVQCRYGSLRNFKISLKNMLRHAPGAGWAMQAAHFLFLHRKWESDQSKIDSFLCHFQNVGSHPQVLLFPEGTDLQPESLAKSKLFAKKNDLPEYQYVLHPRTTGFVSLVKGMQHYNDLKQIVDVTVSYPLNVCQDENQLLAGKLPQEIVFNVRSFDLDKIDCSSDECISDWLQKRWEVKEKYLRNVYQQKPTVDINGVSMYINGNSASKIVKSVDTCTMNGLSEKQNNEIESNSAIFGIGCLIFWFCISVLSVCGIFANVYFRWSFFGMLAVNFSISTFVGFDALFAKLSAR